MANTISKSGLVGMISESTGLTNGSAKAALEAAIDAITAAVQDGTTVSLPGFGSFVCKDIPERQSRNPRTGEAVTVAAHKKLVFQPAAALRKF